MTLHIDILYSEDCTGWEAADQLRRQALADLGLEAEIAYWPITSDAQAIETYFVGSPTIRVNGYDLFPVEGATTGLKLRSYFSEEGLLEYPTYNMLVEALQALVNRLVG